MVIHHNVVDGRLRFAEPFRRTRQSLVLYFLEDFVFLGKSNSLMVSFTFTIFRDVSATSVSDFTVTQDQLLDALLHRIQRRDHFERAVKVLLGVLLRNLLRDFLRDFLWDLLLVPELFGSWERLII